MLAENPGCATTYNLSHFRGPGSRQADTSVGTSMRSVVLIALVVSLPSLAHAQTPGPQLDVLKRASAYIETFVQRFSNVVAEEHYTQEVQQPTRQFGSGWAEAAPLSAAKWSWGRG